MIKKITICIAALVAVFTAGALGFKYIMFLPQRYDDLQPVLELGLFQDLPIENGSCVYSVPPSVRSFVLPFLHSVQSWYGEIVLSDETANTLSNDYVWEEWSVSETEWENGTVVGKTPDDADSFMFEFDKLKSMLVGKQVWISRDFNAEQDKTHRIGQLFCYLDADARTLFFYYTSS